MQPFRTKAIILRRTNYGEADRVLSMITPERGEVSAIAKGVRRPKSKLAGGLELLAVCDVTLLSGRGSMAVVTSARLDTFFDYILRDYDRLDLAYTMMRIIHKAVATVSDPEFYDVLAAGLGYLNTSTIDWRLVEVWFRLQLQMLLGHGLNVATERTGEPLQQGLSYDFDFAEHAFHAHDRGKFTAAHIKVLRLASAKNPAILRQVSGIEDVIDDCVWLLRSREA